MKMEKYVVVVTLLFVVSILHQGETATGDRFCVGKENGNHPDPDRCSGFIMCSWDNTYRMDCPSDLHYNKQKLICDWRHSANCKVGKPTDPCKTENGGCSQTCTNNEGTSKCSCKDGFVLRQNQKTCTKETSPPIPPACGLDKTNFIGTIVGGTEAIKNRWIWQAGIYYNNEFICGGTLIQSDAVLTAAHCVLNKNKDNMVVRMGDHDKDQFEPTEQEKKVDAIFKHENWEIETISNDIAILRFDTGFDLNENVGTACIPTVENPDLGDATCYITGWGKTGKHDNAANKLQQAVMPVLSNDKCGERNKDREGNSRVTDRMLCAGYNGPDSNVSGCKGDSGGPLVCKAKNKNNWVLQGIVSWGSSRCDANHRFTVFTRVSRYIDWIEKDLFPDP